jgi:Thioredoxin like C-terminal domain
VKASGAEAAPSIMIESQSPETYIGYARADNSISPGGAARDKSHFYAAETPRLDQWALSGDWTVSGESARLNREGGRIV